MKYKIVEFLEHKKITSLIFILNLFCILFLVKNYANNLSPFEDEITSLISGINFLTKVNFDGSPMILGNFSPYLTSGPISSIGSSIGWLITENFVYSRIFNFIYLALLSVFFVSLLRSDFIDDTYILFTVTLTSLVIVPWWFGSLYSLGEMFSSVLFVFSVFLLKKYKNLALFLMGLSIIFTKILQLLLVIPFLIIYQLLNKDLSKINFIYFLIPFLVYFSFVYFKNTEYTLIEYIKFYINYIIGHQSSGLDSFSYLKITNIKLNLINSEFKDWSLITKLRLFLSPLILIFTLIFEQKNFEKDLRKLSLPIIASIVPSYLWFWLISETKWIRYSQHFIYLVIFTQIYILLTNKKISFFGFFSNFFSLSLFFSNLYLLIISIFSILVFRDKKSVPIVISLLFLLNSVNLLYESDNLPESNLDFRSCRTDIDSSNCVNDYLPYRSNN